MELGTCLNCKNHDECTFQRVFPVRDCDEYEEMDIAPELSRTINDVLKEWGMLAQEEKTE
jgi:hypothetical protein